MTRSFVSRIALLTIVTAGLSSPATLRAGAAGEEPGMVIPGRPVHTYSIVARDAATGQLGVAVQSHWFSVGGLVTWAEAGVGAVATQSFVEPSYGPLGLDLMRAGKTAPEALRALLAADGNAAVRQVAMIDARGNRAAHTGDLCIAAAGHVEGDGFTAQANLMEKPTVWDAMARAYTAAPGDLAERLLAALQAAEAEGGDIRGRQSAAILVVAGTSTGRPWADRVVDLRVEDSDDPLGELERLLRLARAYRHMDRGDGLFAGGDVDGAAREYGAAETLVPGNVEMVFWHAVTMVNAGRMDDARPLFRRVFADPERGASWAALVPRLPRSKLLPEDPAIIAEIVSLADQD
jgi:uncharacterized Ntn-hydrolase superfamily protein